MPDRSLAAGALAALVVCLGVVAALRVPWHLAPTPRDEQIAALRTLPPEQVARGAAFHAAMRRPAYASMVAGLVIALILGLTPLGAWIVTGAADVVGGGWAAQVLAGGLAVVFCVPVLTLPLRAWARTVSRAYGLSTQSWRGWSVDVLKGYAVTAVLAVGGLAGFYGIARAAPRWWWAWSALGAAVLVVLLSYVFPVLVEPIFNHFAPMPDGDLRRALLALAAADGVPVRDVLVADASRRTRAVNAYVSGFGATRRIVVYDTLLREAAPAEVVSVVAHELGHVRAADVVTGTLIGALGSAAAVVALYLLGSWHGLLDAAGVSGIGSDPRSVALLLAAVAVAGAIGAPAGSLISRRIEAHADTHALVLTGDAETFEAMQARLAAVNLADVDPNRIEYALFASHPSTLRRMAAARVHAAARRANAPLVHGGDLG